MSFLQLDHREIVFCCLRPCEGARLSGCVCVRVTRAGPWYSNSSQMGVQQQVFEGSGGRRFRNGGEILCEMSLSSRIRRLLLWDSMPRFTALRRTHSQAIVGLFFRPSSIVR
ncbi:hypothetical protein COCC4DRAFT_30876 [Bipolaris maydis ATCC 48331]|uniref:Uncharacterized protein n=2 Tax=Cochliobolus heterostrophus TaxID=5016 RepID=M2T9P7_COCH5|nr:uncharacterized protein COCC4DRAFT_30876 [Bipolaris maydis ATCC 48331]EMD94270.1 hypothetical protein COCHEDRAFT_1020294 [Bipolaris maydis C5]ENI07432.1 hypothetical protein COCC4DRAFT_30876 [Bipolaris maydis ATCC 48331]